MEQQPQPKSARQLEENFATDLEEWRNDAGCEKQSADVQREPVDAEVPRRTPPRRGQNPQRRRRQRGEARTDDSLSASCPAGLTATSDVDTTDPECPLSDADAAATRDPPSPTEARHRHGDVMTDAGADRSKSTDAARSKTSHDSTASVTPRVTLPPLHDTRTFLLCALLLITSCFLSVCVLLLFNGELKMCILHALTDASVAAAAVVVVDDGVRTKASQCVPCQCDRHARER